MSLNYDLYGQPKHFQRWWGSDPPKAPPPPPPPPSKSDADIQAERAKAAKLNRTRKGRGASILTGEGTNFLQPDGEGGKTTLG